MRLTMTRSQFTHLVVLLAVAMLIPAGLHQPPGTQCRQGRCQDLTRCVDHRGGDQADHQCPDGVLRFEVAEDHSRFAWAGDPKLTNGVPEGRTAYIAQGYLYPAGTLTDANGVNADGTPEFPDKVLGQWLCYGWYLGPDDHVGAAPWVSSHLFNFGSAWGEATLVSEGFDIDDVGVPMERAIAGGNGPYADARGTQTETNLGLNATDGLNIRFEVQLAK